MEGFVPNPNRLLKVTFKINSEPDKFEKQEVGNSGSNGSKGKIDIKLKTQFRGFSPMLKDTGSKRREMDVIMSTKMFSDGARKAWK